MARKVEVQIVGDARSLERAFGRAQTRSTAFGSALHKLGRMAIYAGAALAAGLTVELVKSVHAAVDAEAAQARLNQAFRDAGVALKPHLAGLERVESASRKLGFTDIEVKDSLGSLIVASHDYRKAIVDLGVAQDLSRFKHVGLTDATKMLTMAMTGSQRAAKQLGIVVIPTTAHVDALKRAHVDLTTALGKSELAHAKLQDKMALGQAVIDQVTAKTRGQAETFSKTAAGALQRFRAQWEHIQVQLGNFFLPTLARVADGFSRVFDWIGKIAKAPTLKIGISIAGKTLADIGKDLQSALFGSTETISAGSTGFLKVFHDGLLQQIEKMNWGAIGSRIAAGIGGSITFSANALDSALSSMLAWVNSHAAKIAAVGAVLATQLVLTLTDPAFWAHHMDLLAAAIVIAFGDGIGRLAGRIGGIIVARLSPVFERAFGEVALLGMRGVARLPALLGDAIAAAGTVGARLAHALWREIVGITDRGVSEAGQAASRLGIFIGRGLRLGAAVAGFRVAISAMQGAWSSFTNFVTSKASAAAGSVRNLFNRLTSVTSHAWHVTANFAIGVIQSAIHWLRTAIHWLEYITGRIWSVHISIPHPSLPSFPGKGLFHSHNPFKASGGFVPGPRGAGDVVPMMLSPGEIILNPAQQQMIGGPRYLSQLFGFRGEHGPGSSMAAGGKVGKKHHRSPRLPASIREAEARAAGTYGLADDIAAYTREERWVDQQLHRHDLTGSERESLRVRRIRVVNRLKSLRRRQAQRRKAPTIDYSQIPARILYKIAKARESGDLYALRAALTEAIYYLKGRLSFIPKLTFAQKTALYDALTSYEQELKDVNDQIAGGDTGGETTADQQAIIDQLRAQLGVAQGSAALANAYVATGVFAGSGPGGSSAPGAGGNGTTIINFNSTVPATDEQAREIAALTATGGASQPYRTSSQAPTGY